MPLIFSYGSLQREDVQRSTFGRRLDGRRDALPGFAPALAAIEDPRVVAATGRTHHANVVFTGDDASRIPGMVFEITDAELARADAYEAADSYARVGVTLASGARAWVYVASRAVHDGG